MPKLENENTLIEKPLANSVDYKDLGSFVLSNKKTPLSFVQQIQVLLDIA